MKTGFGILFFLLAAFTNLHAQTGKSYNVGAGQQVGEALLKANGLYLYPQFADAQVAFKNGNSGYGRMNYNKLLGELQFIGPNNDTLTMDNGKETNYVAIGKDTFFYADACLQMVDAFGMRVAKKTVLELTNRRAIGGMGEQNAGGTTSYTSMSNRHGIKELVPNEALTFSEATTYFIADRFNRFKPLNRKSLHNLYPKQEKVLDAYLDANAVNFVHEADVLRLIGFLKTL